MLEQLTGRARAALRWIAALPGALLSRSDAVLLVTRSDLVPANHGAAVKIDATARALAELVSAVYVVTADRRRYYRYRAGRREELPVPWLIRKLAPRSRVVSRRLLGAELPPAEGFLYLPWFDWSFASRSLYVAVRHGVRRYQAEFPIYARACLPVRAVLRGTLAIAEHNVEYARLSAQYALSPATAGWVRAVELSLCDRADFVVAVSALDRDTLIRDGVPAGKIRVIPHGVDLRGFAAAAPLDVRRRLGIPADRPILAYHGVYSYSPNLEAMEFLAREILPRLHGRGIAPKVMAIGPQPPEESPHPDIVFTGPVAEVAPFLLAADAAVVPLLQGGGTRMKVLDYFAAGLAVVSTAKGVEGLGVTDGEQALVRDDPGAFADAVVEVLASPGRRSSLGRAGQRFAASLDWSRIAEGYLAEYRACEARHGAS